MKETLKEAGYTLVRNENGTYILRDANGHHSRWVANRYHASYGLTYKNTHLEFCSSFTTEEDANEI